MRLPEPDSALAEWGEFFCESAKELVAEVVLARCSAGDGFDENCHNHLCNAQTIAELILMQADYLARASAAITIDGRPIDVEVI